MDENNSIKDKAAHVYTDDADTTCDTCGYERTITPPAHEHRYGDWRNTTFIVNSFFREKSDESIAVKLERLMKADVQKEATT